MTTTRNQLKRNIREFIHRGVHPLGPSTRNRLKTIEADVNRAYFTCLQLKKTLKKRNRVQITKSLVIEKKINYP